MMDLRVRHKPEDIARHVESHGYGRRRNINFASGTVASRRWRVYTRMGSGDILNIVYVSNANEIMHQQTFASDRGLDDTEVLDEMLRIYTDSRQEAERVSFWANIAVFPATLVGGYLGSRAGAFGGVMGALAGFFGTYAVAFDQKRKIYGDLDDYLDNHNILLGKKAWAYIGRQPMPDSTPAAARSAGAQPQ